MKHRYRGSHAEPRSHRKDGRPLAVVFVISVALIVLAVCASAASCINGGLDSSTKTASQTPISSRGSSFSRGAASAGLPTASSSAKGTETAASRALAVADYCDKMQPLYERLIAAIDMARDAEANGDVAAAQAALRESDDAYGEVLRVTAPAEAKDVDYRMRQAAASMNSLVAFYEDATDAKVGGDWERYAEDLDEITIVLGETNTNLANLDAALQDLTAQYR